MTQGESLYDAICMARDCLGAYSLDQKPPMPSSLDEAIRIAKEKADDDDFIWSCGTPFYVDIDTEEYRKRITPSVTKTCTIPSWLNDQAEAAGIDFSSVLFCSAGSADRIALLMTCLLADAGTEFNNANH